MLQADSVICGEIPYAMEQGIFVGYQGISLQGSGKCSRRIEQSDLGLGLREKLDGAQRR